MTWPSENEILIDTNVFKHLCDRDPNHNGDGHVGVLLSVLASRKCVLLIDDAGLFRHEFREIVEPQFRRASEIAGEIAILRYWADPSNYEERETARNRDLVKLIKKVIIENERADRAFVYIALSNGRVLVTNDKTHIVEGPATKKERGGNRRTRLFNIAKKHVVNGAAILLSREAHASVGIA